MATLRKALIVFVPVIVWVVLFGLGCQKKEDKEKAQKGPAAPIGPHVEKSASLDKKQMPPDMGGEYPKEMMEALQKMQPEKAALPRAKKDHVPVSVSPDVRSKWKAVVIEVANKQTNEQEDYVVDINKSFVIPNTKIKIDVLAFLPDFSMSPKGITSLSNEPKNPAVKVVIREDDKKIFESWLFQKLPTIHPFEHKVYGIKLRGQKPA